MASKKELREFKAVTRRLAKSGYYDCGCRDCFDIAIGLPGDMCHSCELAGCVANAECQRPDAYNYEEDP